MALLDPVDRMAIRSAALAGLGNDPANERAWAIVGELTQDSTAAQVELQAAVDAALASWPARLQ